MSVIYFLICVRKHESNLRSSNRTTAGEENTMIYRKIRPFTKVCVFLPVVFVMFSIRTLCFYDFCKTVLVKKIHTLPRYDLIFPYQMPQMLHWLLCGTLTTQLKPIQPQNNMKKWVEGTALELPLGFTCPRPCEPEF